MANNLITIDIDAISKLGLTVNDYLLLYYLYSVKKNINEKFRQNYILISNYDSVINKGWLFVQKHDDGVRVELRDKVYNLFEGDKDYFLEWFSKFPIKTPSGRYLKVKDADTNAGRELHKKWRRHFKNKADKARKAIKVLEAEMEHRRRNNKFEFMHNAETWLNQYDYEKYEYLLDEIKVFTSRKEQDYL